jgi:hypothetical protein
MSTEGAGQGAEKGLPGLPPGDTSAGAVPAPGDTSAGAVPAPGDTPAGAVPVFAPVDGAAGAVPVFAPGAPTSPADAMPVYAPGAPIPPGAPIAPAAPAAPGAPPAWTWTVPNVRRRRPARGIALAVLLVLGLAGVGGGGAALAHELTRGPTKAEMAAAVQQEVASRWQRLAAGQIFPATISYSTADFDVTMTARRVGIAPATTCAAALDPSVSALLRRFGCVTVLRATYVDQSGTLAATAAVAVMTSAAAASGAGGIGDTSPPGLVGGVRTFSLPGTVADLFGDPQRRAFSGVDASQGQYVLLWAAGYTDGRVSGSATATPGLVDLGNGVLVGVQAAFTAHGSACAMKDIRC